jgi:hypothetical protein
MAEATARNSEVCGVCGKPKPASARVCSACEGKVSPRSWWTEETDQGGTRRFSALMALICLFAGVFAWLNYGAFTNGFRPMLRDMASFPYFESIGGLVRLVFDVAMLGLLGLFCLVLLVIIPIMGLYATYMFLSARSSKSTK